jgi:signal transduction histidine kinase
MSQGPKNFHGSSSALRFIALDSLRRRRATRGSPNVQAEPNISWTELRKFVGQLNHDLRNHLNAIELQAACLNETVGEAETGSDIKRLREMTGDLCTHLQRLSTSLAGVQPNTMSYLAGEFFEDLRAKLGLEEPELAAEVEWKSSLGEEALEIDPHLLEEAFLELFCNAVAHERGNGALGFDSRREANQRQSSMGKRIIGANVRSAKFEAGIMVLASFGPAVFLRHTMARSALNLIQTPPPWSRRSRCPSSWLKPIAGLRCSRNL